MLKTLVKEVPVQFVPARSLWDTERDYAELKCARGQLLEKRSNVFPCRDDCGLVIEAANLSVLLPIREPAFASSGKTVLSAAHRFEPLRLSTADSQRK